MWCITQKRISGMSKEGDVAIIRLLIINELSFSVKLSEQTIKTAIERSVTQRESRDSAVTPSKVESDKEEEGMLTEDKSVLKKSLDDEI